MTCIRRIIHISTMGLLPFFLTASVRAATLPPIKTVFIILMENNNSALKLTTASYWRPSGKNIHRFPDAKDTDEWGVKPDEGFEVPIGLRLHDGLIIFGGADLFAGGI